MNKRTTKSKSNHKMYCEIQHTREKKHMKRREKKTTIIKACRKKTVLWQTFPRLGKNDSIVVVRRQKYKLLAHYTNLIVILAQVILVLFVFQMFSSCSRFFFTSFFQFQQSWTCTGFLLLPHSNLLEGLSCIVYFCIRPETTRVNGADD